MKELRDKNSKEISSTDKIVIFFFGILFVLLLGRHYFANLRGGLNEKSQMLKWYLLGIGFLVLSFGSVGLSE
ncbi:hypothetical protein [Flagellimonas sp.]|uniref:hypothetical protein n=1 Tax=Flagellimonas sp. TaxID=2058762 RepID=UPI003BAFFCBD